MTRPVAGGPRPSPGKAFAALVALLALACGGPSERPSDLVLILIDTLRADHVGAYGYGRPTTPALDELARRSLLFENAIAQSSWTQPSVMSFFTSRYPQEFGADHPFSVLPDEAQTLAEVLREAGYATVAVSTNPHCAPSLGLMQGFEDTRLELKAPASWVVENALSAVDRAREAGPHRPLFLFVHFMDVHAPLEPPEAHAARFLPPPPERASLQLASKYWLPPARRQEEAFRRKLEKTSTALYDAALRFVDDEIGRLLEALSTRGIAGNAVIAVLSDHGESHWEHEDFEARMELRKLEATLGTGHGYALFPELLRIPFVLRIPGRGPLRIPERVRGIDVAPTLLSALGLDPGRLGGRGEDLLAWLDRGRPELPALSVTQGEDVPQLSYLRGPWQLMRVRDRDLLFPWPQVDLPGLLARHPEEAARLRRELEDLLDRVPEGRADEAVIPPELVEMLERLGYARGGAPPEKRGDR